MRRLVVALILSLGLAGTAAAQGGGLVAALNQIDVNARAISTGPDDMVASANEAGAIQTYAAALPALLGDQPQDVLDQAARLRDDAASLAVASQTQDTTSLGYWSRRVGEDVADLRLRLGIPR
jgi:hypothetical protein